MRFRRFDLVHPTKGECSRHVRLIPPKGKPRWTDYEVQLAKLLSSGWKIVAIDDQPTRGSNPSPDAAPSEGSETKKAPPHTDKQSAEKPLRGHRSQRKRPAEVQPARSKGSCNWMRPEGRASPEALLAAEQAAGLLGELAGKASLKAQASRGIDVSGLLLALETGDNPLPFLESPIERPRARVLVTPDCSGSTQGWSWVARAWARALSSHPELEVAYVENCNGSLYKGNGSSGSFTEKEERLLLGGLDLLVYLGDEDGRLLAEARARAGTLVIALDSFAASVQRPRLRSSERGRLLWIDRVSAKAPLTWVEGLRLALKSA